MADVVAWPGPAVYCTRIQSDCCSLVVITRLLLLLLLLLVVVVPWSHHRSLSHQTQRKKQLVIAAGQSPCVMSANPPPRLLGSGWGWPVEDDEGILADRPAGCVCIL